MSLSLILKLTYLRFYVKQHMERQGYGEEYIRRYKMMTRFHHQRVPLVILVCGTACVGKSTIAAQLAQRLNLPNVLQTDMVYELLRTSTDAPLTSTPVWARDFSSSEELISEFFRECRIVRKGLAGDLKKAMKDGKPVIIEGLHLDPNIYLMDEEHKSSANIPEKSKESSPVSSTDDDPATKMEDNPTNAGESHTENRKSTPGNVNLEEGKCGDQWNKDPVSQEYVKTAGGKTVRDTETERDASIRKENLGPEPIIIPIVLKMAKFDHKALLEEWIVTHTYSDKSPVAVQDKDRIITNLKTIRNYLCSFKSQGLTVANISATTFTQTLDWLHGHILQCIEQGISSMSSGNIPQPAEN
ncbi:uncharacterized protein LOC105636435 isoform X2 [Jatropha curcas]|uniref:uncharacterized protein LOC105636435 isoform X2 n=1 Tax=Jatropha curcas TaxID=180498 RepID=UPI0009D6DEFE|nr:uncharacterized protein LOC105636435 isoform X2 [Jatropha curcas]XP_020535902.1 uncharacterized protein LOC105636435 isoform X2 [Jatropha curcas]